jgi:hypothetical protein
MSGRKPYLVAAAFLLVFFIPILAGGEGRLSVTGLIDRAQINRGEAINVTLVVSNPSEKVATDCAIEIRAGDATSKGERFSLSPSEEHPETLKLVLDHDGQIQVVALVCWAEGGIAKATVLPISQVNVSSADWLGGRQLQPYWWLATGTTLAMLLLAAWWLRRSPQLGSPILRWKLILGLLLFASLTLLARGLFFSAATLVVPGVVLLLVGLLLWLLGEKDSKRLFSRIQKAGPLEFSMEKTEHFEVLAAKEREFKRPEARVEAADVRSILHNYINLYRLKAHMFESRLIRLNPPVPAVGASREMWLDYLCELAGDDLPDLKHLRGTIRAYEQLKRLFDKELSKKLAGADKDRAGRERKVREALTLIDHFETVSASRNSFVPPHCLTVKADLQMVLDEREAALSTLYQAQSIHPDSLVANYALGFYLTDLVSDHYTAVSYGDNALLSVCKMQDDLRDSYGAVSRVVRDAPVDHPIAAHLRQELERYRNGLLRELQTFLKGVHYAMKNFIAYSIASADLTPREADAIRYAEAASAAYPTNAAYLDTWGFAKLRFGIHNRDRNAVKESLKILTQAVYYSDYSRNDELTKKLIRRHHKQAHDVLRRREWD